MFHRLLVAFDGTPAAHRAVATAVELARANDARLTVIAAVHDLSDVFFGSITSVEFGDLAAQTERKCRAMLDTVVESVPDDIPTAGILGHGSPGPAILDEVRAGGHDLVLIGSRRRGGLRTLLLGSVSRHVLDASPVPVLLVPAATDHPNRELALAGRQLSSPR